MDVKLRDNAAIPAEIANVSNKNIMYRIALSRVAFT